MVLYPRIHSNVLVISSVSHTCILTLQTDDWFNADSLGCYKFLDSKVNLSWVEAQLECEEEGGYLAEPITQSEAEFLAEIATLEGSFTGITYWYIGLTDLGREGDWLWLHNDEAVSYHAWAPHHPTNHSKNTEDCGVMVVRNNKLTWEDHHCLIPDIQHHMVAPVCQYDITHSSPQTTTIQPDTSTHAPCPHQWTEFNSSCFRYFSSRITWVNAEEECVTLGGHLASVHSAQENMFLQSLASGDSFWLGGYPTGEGDWVWSDLTDFDYLNDYDAISSGCLFQHQNSYSDGWSSTKCDTSGYAFFFVCKL